MMRLVFWVAIVALVSCRQALEQQKFEGRTMGTTWHLTIVGSHDGPELRRAVQERLNELDDCFTNWRPSPVTRFNASHSDDWQDVPRELTDMVSLAGKLSEATGGAFDITASPLVDAWGFGPGGRIDSPPSEQVILSAKKHVDWRKLEVRTEPPALRKLDLELQINVSAMADGYACDDLAKMLRARGVKNYLLEIGGAVIAMGTNAEGRPWHAGIQRPHAETGESVNVLELRDQAVSTSGVYRQYFESDGKRYAHVLDARTSRPITHDLVSVSVVSPSAFFADGWDTALLILGPEEGRALAKKLGIDALFIAESK